MLSIVVIITRKEDLYLNRQALKQMQLNVQHKTTNVHHQCPVNSQIVF